MLDRTALARKIAAAIVVPDELSSYLAGHGLVIVESARHDKLMTTLQLVGSVLEPIVTEMGAREFPPGVWRLLRDVVTKIGEL